MANEEMIQRHADNFLAAIAGETPVDDNVRNSKEFWLKKIAEMTADWLAGKSTDDASTKKIYIHPITIAGITNQYIKIDGNNAIGRLNMLIFDNDPTPYTPARLVSFINNLYNDIGNTVRIICNGCVFLGSVPYVTNHIFCTAVDTFNIALVNISNGTPLGLSIDLANLAEQSGLFDDGVNAIN